MHLSVALLSTLLLFLTLATALPSPSLPLHHRTRAGGPTAKPIPSNCTIDSPQPTIQPSTTSFQTSLAANASTVYYYFTSAGAGSFNATQCLEQCYGFGSEGSCKSVFIADQALTPVGYYGTAGGARATACLMFDRYLVPGDFVAPEVQGTYLNATAQNIVCGNNTLSVSRSPVV